MKVFKPNMAKFCANLSFMFTEYPFLERYQRAKDAGFKAVETGFPFNIPEKDVIAAKSNANIQQILINTFTGDVTKGELGFAAIPGKEMEFKQSIDLTIKYAKLLGARKVHIMSGKEENPTKANEETYVNNLKYAVKLLEKDNLLGLIEPINNYSVPGYYMNSYERALHFVQMINSPNLKIMCDIFHLQHIRGNLTNSIKEMIDFIGHVQIAQVPLRNEPDTQGEIDYCYVLDMLKNVGYDDWIGLEYKPKKGSAEGLEWIRKFGYEL